MRAVRIAALIVAATVAAWAAASGFYLAFFFIVFGLQLPTRDTVPIEVILAVIAAGVILSIARTMRSVRRLNVAAVVLSGAGIGVLFAICYILYLASARANR